MKTLSIINLKGGVAKTISAVTMAYILSAEKGYRVLLVDNDKQGNASKMLDRHSYSHKGIETLMTERLPVMAAVIQHTDYDNLDIITANMELMLAASDYVMIPVTIDDFALDGLSELAEQIENTREDLNPSLRLLGCFVTQYATGEEADRQGEEILRGMEYPVFETHIRRTEKVKPATFLRVPVPLYSNRCAASLDYRKLTEEFLERSGIINVKEE